MAKFKARFSPTQSFMFQKKNEPFANTYNCDDYIFETDDAEIIEFLNHNTSFDVLEKEPVKKEK